MSPPVKAGKVMQAGKSKLVEAAAAAPACHRRKQQQQARSPYDSTP